MRHVRALWEEYSDIIVFIPVLLTILIFGWIYRADLIRATKSVDDAINTLFYGEENGQQ